MQELRDLFGKSVSLYKDRIQRLPAAWEGTTYEFADPDEYGELLLSNSPAAMKIYWYEILARAHMAATTSIVRSARWLDGVEVGLKATNLLATAACLRGFLEAAADSVDALCAVPEELARNRARIETALSGRGQDLFLHGDLENELIHFLYGRHLRPGEKAPKTHQKKRPTEYNQMLERAHIPLIGELYSQLCQLTHPAAHSVLSMFRVHDEASFSFTSRFDEEGICAIAENFKETLFQLPIFAFNPGIVTLAVLNYFSVSAFHSPRLLEWELLVEIPAWGKCLRQLDGVTACCAVSPNVTPPN